MRADGWARLPLIRMTNVSLQPGEQSLDEVFDVAHGIYMETNRSWSIDDKRYNFQFGCEIAWEIRDGKRVRMLKNPELQRHLHRVLECLRRHRRAASTGRCGAFPTAARASPSR